MAKQPTPLSATQRAIDSLGNKSRAAEIIGVSRQTVWAWYNGACPSAEHAIRLSQVSREPVRASWIRPSLAAMETGR